MFCIVDFLFCVHVCRGCIDAMAHVQSTKDNFWESVLPLSHVGPGDQTRVSGLAAKVFTNHAISLDPGAMIIDSMARNRNSDHVSVGKSVWDSSYKH